ncbi:MAG: hypothetical protein EOP85_12965 [Verrucomicrobiaceae bacterium]|nr:MAG: hypothetical protein EOP85_12965 [Verrucomicrobiaceae bacterium]
MELDLNGNVKVWAGGAVVASVQVGKTKGTLTAAFACASFAAGSPVSVNVYLDGVLLDLDPSGPGSSRTFAWPAADTNFIALSARATNQVMLDNFVVRKLPVSTSLVIEHALQAGLDGSDSAPGANPDGDRLDNFGEWAFGTDPSKADDHLAATSLVLSQPDAGVFRFAFRRLIDHLTAGVGYHIKVSEDLVTWRDAATEDETTAALPASAGYEAVTVSLPAAEVNGHGKLFVRVAAR